MSSSECYRDPRRMPKKSSGAFGAELLVRLDGSVVPVLHRVFDGFASENFAEHIRPEVGVVERIRLRGWCRGVRGALERAGIVEDCFPDRRDVLGILRLGELGLIPAPLARWIDVTSADLEDLLEPIRGHQRLDDLERGLLILGALHDEEVHGRAGTLQYAAAGTEALGLLEQYRVVSDRVLVPD